MKMQRSFSTALVVLGILLGSCADTSDVSAHDGAGLRLVDDPVSAIRAILPVNWVVDPIKEKAHPPLLVPGEGKAIRFFRQDQEYAPWYSGVYVYIMPREYSGARNNDLFLTADHPPAASLILTTEDARVYISMSAHNDWPNMAEELIDALTIDNS